MCNVQCTIYNTTHNTIQYTIYNIQYTSVLIPVDIPSIGHHIIFHLLIPEILFHLYSLGLSQLDPTHIHHPNYIPFISQWYRNMYLNISTTYPLLYPLLAYPNYIPHISIFQWPAFLIFESPEWNQLSLQLPASRPRTKRSKGPEPAPLLETVGSSVGSS